MIHDEIHKQQELIKNKSWKDKLGYFIYYNKIKLAAGIIIFIFLLCLLSGILENSKKKSIFVVLVNTTLEDSSQTTLLEDFMSSRSISPNSNPGILDLSIKIARASSDALTENNKERLWFYLQEDHIDIVAGNDWLLDIYSDIKPFRDLSEVLPEDLQEKFVAGFYYYDYEEYGKIPIAVDVSGCDKLKNTGIYPKEDQLFLAIPVTSSHLDTAIDFLRYLYE